MICNLLVTSEIKYFSCFQKYQLFILYIISIYCLPFLFICKKKYVKYINSKPFCLKSLLSFYSLFYCYLLVTSFLNSITAV